MINMENMVPIDLYEGATVKFKSACPIIVELVGVNNVATIEGYGTFTTTTSGTYRFENTCGCTSYYEVRDEGTPSEEDCCQSQVILLEEIRDAIMAADTSNVAATQALIATIDDGITAVVTVDGQPIDVNVVTSVPLTTTGTLDAAILAELQNLSVTIDGQPIDVTVTNAVTVNGTVTAVIDTASITALANAIAGETLTIDDAAIIAAINASDDLVLAELQAQTQQITDVTTTNCAGDDALRVFDNCHIELVNKTLFDCAGNSIVVRQSIAVDKTTGSQTYLTGVVTSSTMSAHVVDSVVASITSAPFSDYFDAELYPNGTPQVVDDELIDGFVGITQTVSVLGNDVNISSVSLVSGSEVNATVVDNGDGTFELTPNACDGAFQYQTASGCIATVNWDWTARNDESFSLSTSDETTVNLRLDLSGGGSYEIDWGDGNTSSGVTGAYSTHTYATPYTGDITATYSGCESVPNLYSNQGHWDFDVANIPATVGTSTFNVTGQNTINGDIANIPVTVGTTNFDVSGQNTINGDVANIPETVGTTNFIVQGQNTITGDVANIPATVGTTNFTVAGQNTIGGDVANIPETVGTTYFRVAGQNTINGDIANIPATVGTSTFIVQGQNTITGDVANIPATVGTSTFNVQGQNTINGDVANIPATVGTTNFYVWGQNTIGGDVANIPATVGTNTFDVRGQNTIFGTTPSIPPTVGTSNFVIQGNNTITGSLATVPATVGTVQLVIGTLT